MSQKPKKTKCWTVQGDDGKLWISWIKGTRREVVGDIDEHKIFGFHGIDGKIVKCTLELAK